VISLALQGAGSQIPLWVQIGAAILAPVFRFVGVIYGQAALRLPFRAGEPRRTSRMQFAITGPAEGQQGLANWISALGDHSSR
jgi:hypothetical protein